MATYPDPEHIANTPAVALGSSVDDMTQISYPAYEAGPAANLYAQINRMISEILAALAHPNGGRVMDEGGLLIGAFPYRYEIAATQYFFEGATGQAVTANQTNYVWVDTDEALEISTGGWPGTEYRALAIVVAGAADITSVTDVRGWNIGRGSSEGWAANAATTHVDVDGNDIINVDEIELDDASADASAVGRIRRNGAKFTIHDGTAAREILTTADVVTAANGGTGLAAITAYNLLVGNGTGAAALVAPGTTGVPLCSQGAAADPAFAALDLSDTNATAAAALPESRGGTGSVEQYSIPFTHTIFIPGVLTAAVWAERFRVPEGAALTITKVSCNADTAPTGASLITDVRDDTTSIFSDVQGNMPTIVAGANSGDATLGAAHVAAADSWIDVQIEQIGSGTAGSDLSVVITGYLEHRA